MIAIARGHGVNDGSYGRHEAWSHCARGEGQRQGWLAQTCLRICENVQILGCAFVDACAMTLCAGLWWHGALVA